MVWSLVTVVGLQIYCLTVRLWFVILECVWFCFWCLACVMCCFWVFDVWDVCSCGTACFWLGLGFIDCVLLMWGKLHVRIFNLCCGLLCCRWFRFAR